MTKFYSILWILFTIVAIPFKSTAQISSGKTEIDSGNIQKLVLKYMKDERIPGFSVGIVSTDRIIYAKSFGFKDLDNHIPATNNDPFHIASISKTFTAIAVMKLVEENKLNLDSPVVRYLSYFKTAGRDHEKITVRQLLSHTSGLPQVLADDRRFDKGENKNATEVTIKNLSEVKLLDKPGKRYSYSNYGFIVLAAIVSQVSGTDFPAFIKQEILSPLKMSNSFYTELTPGGVAVAYQRTPKEVKRSVVHVENEAMAGAGGLMSNINDMCTWSMFALNRGQVNGHRILREQTFDTMLSADVVEYSDSVYTAKRGLGWQLITNAGTEFYGHAGRYLWGGRTFMLVVPAKSLAIVFLSNVTFDTEWDLMMAIENLL
jgi:CubicO group peptidase (beta-lactamase class C family)